MTVQRIESGRINGMIETIDLHNVSVVFNLSITKWDLQELRKKLYLKD